MIPPDEIESLKSKFVGKTVKYYRFPKEYRDRESRVTYYTVGVVKDISPKGQAQVEFTTQRGTILKRVWATSIEICDELPSSKSKLAFPKRKSNID